MMTSDEALIHFFIGVSLKEALSSSNIITWNGPLFPLRLLKQLDFSEEELHAFQG